MGDVEHRDACFLLDPLEERQDLLLQALVERGQRLVEQQQARRVQQRASEGDALTLAAGQQGRTPVQQWHDLQQFGDGLQLQMPCLRRNAVEAVQQVAADRQVREQLPVLEDQAEVPFPGRHEASDRRVDQQIVVRPDAFRCRASTSRQ